MRRNTVDLNKIVYFKVLFEEINEMTFFRGNDCSQM